MRLVATKRTNRHANVVINEAGAGWGILLRCGRGGWSGWLGRKVLLWAGLPFLALLGLALGVPDVTPAWQAKSGGGTAGTFTALHEKCSRYCVWYGDFVPDGAGRRVTTSSSTTGRTG